MTNRITLTNLECLGEGQRSAEVRFAPGLNVISGASNTGKTFVFRLIDFLLGSSDRPPTIPEAQGYQRAVLSMASTRQGTLNLTRALAGGDVRLDIVPIRAEDPIPPPRTLRWKHVVNDDSTLSAFLLSLVDLSGRQVRRNERGEKSSLTFRDVSWLTMIDEQRIIGTGSPALSGQYVEDTKERSVFGYFLTGSDDAAIVTVERPGNRRARLEAEAAAIQEIIEDRERRQPATTLPETQAQLQRTDTAIAEVTVVVSTTQQEIAAAEEQRRTAWQRLQQIRSRRLLLNEQISRLLLLAECYQSDLNRLDAMAEAGSVFAELPDGTCPICGSSPGESATGAKSLLQIHETACQTERGKIVLLQADLTGTIESLRVEEAEWATEQASLNGQIASLQSRVASLLAPRTSDAGEQLNALLTQRDTLQRSLSVQEELVDLRARHDRIRQALRARAGRREKLPPKVETTTTTRFCEVVRSLLEEWKYPNLKSVDFDVERFDLVINSQNRGDMGKGYRAFTHAAFTIGLMRCCRQIGVPHPGVVVLDTPLNPLRGPDDGPEGKVNDEIKQAFFRSLAADKSGDQVIILENTEPPEEVRSSIAYTHFTANSTAGRYGFFPAIPVPAAGVV